MSIRELAREAYRKECQEAEAAQRERDAKERAITRSLVKTTLGEVFGDAPLVYDLVEHADPDRLLVQIEDLTFMFRADVSRSYSPDARLHLLYPCRKPGCENPVCSPKVGSLVRLGDLIDVLDAKLAARKTAEPDTLHDCGIDD